MSGEADWVADVADVIGRLPVALEGGDPDRSALLVTVRELVQNPHHWTVIKWGDGVAFYALAATIGQQWLLHAVHAEAPVNCDYVQHALTASAWYQVHAAVEPAGTDGRRAPVRNSWTFHVSPEYTVKLDTEFEAGAALDRHDPEAFAREFAKAVVASQAR
jgi:hypothetical protein